MDKGPRAFPDDQRRSPRTSTCPQHVLRFWEDEVHPDQGDSSRRRRPALLTGPEDVDLLRGHPASALRRGLHDQGRAAHPQERGRALRRGGGGGRGQGRAVPARARRRRQRRRPHRPPRRGGGRLRREERDSLLSDEPPHAARRAPRASSNCERLLAALREPSGKRLTLFALAAPDRACARRPERLSPSSRRSVSAAR